MGIRLRFYMAEGTKCLSVSPQIQTKRVDCFRDLTSFMKSVASATVESIEASLKVRSAEMSVTFLQQEYERAKVEQESAEVYTHTYSMYSMSIPSTTVCLTPS